RHLPHAGGVQKAAPVAFLLGEELCEKVRGDSGLAGAARFHAVHIAMPPLTSSTWPVTKPAAGEARYRTLAPISMGSAKRPMGVTSSTDCSAFSGTPSSMRVFTKPGAMALTVTPLRAYSRARALVNPINPALAAA